MAKKRSTSGNALEQAFLSAILANPEDDAPRLVYADWLEENGNADRAEFIRLQIERARRPCYDRSKIMSGPREQALGKAHAQEWFSPLPEYTRGKIIFVRGFPGEAHVGIEDFVNWDARVWQAAPVTGVHLTDSYGDWSYRPAEEREPLLRALASKPELAHVRLLSLGEGSAVAADLAILLDSPYWTHLRTLWASDCSLGDEGARIVAGSKRLPALKELRLGACGIGPEGAAALVSSPLLGQLEVFDLSNSAIGDAVVEQLATSPQARNLVELSLFVNGHTDSAARALADSPYLSRLSYLCLIGNEISPAGQAVLRERFGAQAVLEFDASDVKQ